MRIASSWSAGWRTGWLVLAFGFLAPACTPYVPRFDYSAEPNPARLPYIIGPGDLLDIKQWKNPDVSGRVRVLPDGNIAVPLLGLVQVAGLDASQVRDKLARALSRYITQNDEMPTLTVAVDEFQSYAVSVIGEVSQPGHYQPGHFVTVLDALALGHGLTPYARGNDLFILRKTAQGSRKIPISYPALVSGRHTEMNLHLLSGDVLVVP